MYKLQHSVYLIILWASPVICQSTDTTELRYHANLLYAELYKNHTTMSYLAPFGEFFAPHKYILSAEINPNFFVLANHQSRIAVAISPQVRIRIRSNSNPGDSSSPVRTPSYNIEAKVLMRYNLFFRKTEDTIRFQYWMTSFSHHSNGQDGNALQPNGSFNTYNGNFSTNYLKIGFNWGKREQTYKDSGMVSRLLSDDYLQTIRLNRKYKNLFQTELEWHPSFTFPGLNNFMLLEHEEKLNGQYGFLKAHFRFTHFITNTYQLVRNKADKKKLKSGQSVQTAGSLTRDIWRIEFKTSYTLNHLDNFRYPALSKRLNVETAVHFTPRFMSQTAFFIATGYCGEDNYNIYFQDKYFYLRAGISTGYLIYNTSINH